MKKIWLWRLILIFYVLFIFSNSGKPAAVSSQESGWLLTQIQILALKTGISAGWLTEHILRKAAHFGEYALLGLLAGRDFHLSSWPWNGAWERAAIFLFGVPFLDETIQLFTPGRSGQINDVWLDMAGAVFGAALYGWARRYIRRAHRDPRP